MKKLYLTIFIMLALAVFPLPYGYYKLLKIVICGFTSYLIFTNTRKDDIKMIDIMLFIIAILYNPIITISFPKEIWSCINVITIIGLFIHGKTLKSL